MLIKQSFIPFFHQMAVLCASKSKDPSSKCGAVVVGPKLDVRGIGFNGICRSVGDDNAIYPERYDRTKTKYLYFEHAERNAIYNCARNGTSTEGCAIFVTGVPCADCARAIIQAGIIEVHINSGKAGACLLSDNRWEESMNASKQMFHEADVKVHYDSNQEIPTD